MRSVARRVSLLFVLVPTWADASIEYDTHGLKFQIAEGDFRFEGEITGVNSEDDHNEVDSAEDDRWQQRYNRELVSKGTVIESLQCQDLSTVSSTIVSDPTTLDVRRFALTFPKDSSLWEEAKGTLNDVANAMDNFGGEEEKEDGNEFGSSGEDAPAESLSVMGVRFQTMDITGGTVQKTKSVLDLGVEFDPADDQDSDSGRQEDLDELPDGTFVPLSAFEVRADTIRLLGVRYVCKQAGEALVRMHVILRDQGSLQAGDMSADGDNTTVCFQWRKQCSMDWHQMEVQYGSTAVWKKGEALEYKFPDPITERTSSFSISALGLLHLSPPTVDVDDFEVLEADLRTASHAALNLEVSDVEEIISVTYLCKKAGTTKVTMRFKRVSAQGVERTLSWNKKCADKDDPAGGNVEHMKVLIASATYANSTEAVKQGKALPGFARPCRSVGKNRGKNNVPDTPAAGCVAQKPVLTIPRRDQQTTITLESDSGSQLPMLQSSEISVNKRMLIAKLVKTRSEELVIKYSCLRDGVTNVTLTLQMYGDYKPVDMAWRKRCASPRIIVERTLTAPQAISAVFLLLILCGVSMCFLLYRTTKVLPSDEPQQDVEAVKLVAAEGSQTDADGVKHFT